MGDKHFDAVVVGSGFGGSVMAYRLASAGLSVCLLERGKVYPPGSFPRSPSGLGRNFWDPSEGGYGMFDVWSFRPNRWSFRGLEVVVPSGLGGGSLIYANVLIRKDEHWFPRTDDEYWPVNRNQLNRHYAHVEKMLGAQQYPFGDDAPYNQTPKTAEFKAAARRTGRADAWFLPNLAVTFRNPGETPVPGEPIREARQNMHGRTRYTCRLCGECDIGCNFGSKNTLDYNYLTEAQRHGADIRPNSEVRWFKPRAEGGYAISYVRHRPDDREGQQVKTRRLPQHTLTADRLILSAGSLGTTYLLLKNRRYFPDISEKLGTRFSGNGDLLTFMFDSKERHGRKSRPRVLEPGYGPVITSAIRYPDQLDGGDGRGYYIEDAGYPAFLSWLLETSQPGLLRRFARFGLRRLQSLLTASPVSNLSGEISSLIGDGDFSSSSLPMLGMGRDLPSGTMSLNRKGYLTNDWRIDESQEYFDSIRSSMQEIAQTMDARFRDNPIWGLSRVVTVHPLGGCPMGRDSSEGVVDENGRVFGYPGLYVADGSVMPGPVGPNPALTIAALSDRFAEHLLQEV